MKDRKETLSYIAVIIALMGCCLLLPIILAGGGLAFIGGYFNGPWILAVGISIIFIAVLAFIWGKKGVVQKMVKKENQ